MRKKPPSTSSFPLTLSFVRSERGWTQDTMAAKLAVSKRTLSDWENGYRFPPLGQRPHVVLTLLEMPSAHVLEIADALGVGAHPLIAPLLEPHRAALRPPEPNGATVEARAPATPEALRAAVDTIVRDAADAMNVPANDLRLAIGRVLATCDELGATTTSARDAVAVRPRAVKPAAGDGS